ncbi:MAG TPA: aminotransferase class V-fold PLP-dependent enzyme [Mycobacteriales bacterium]|nr:aminotransferase class V-fold PLP-dependent enzyme [Mycobacteriales bacterium]
MVGRKRTERAAFEAAYPGYRSTSRIDELRASEYGYLDERGETYLDYAGAGLPARAQLRAHAGRIAAGYFGNPHSDSPASTASTELVEHTRAAILAHFNADPAEYAAIFTPNATGACRLVGEAYPFGPGTRLVLTFDNHNSVNGIREFARARGAVTSYVPLTPELRVDEPALAAALGSAPRSGGGRPGLLALPAQSNFSGVQHPLRLVELAQRLGYDVLLDAAAFVPTNRLDLSRVHPDFVPVSWYKVFGYPTGVGCLLARREALQRLRRPWFSGGTIQAVSVQGDWHLLAGDESGYEDGTVNFLSIPDVAFGLSWLDGIGLDTVHRRVGQLTGWLLHRLGTLRHGTGAPLVRVYGPSTVDGRGATVAFNFLDPAGRIVDERIVGRDAAAARISLRTGCFCNPGAGEGAFDIPVDALTGSIRRQPRTIDEYLELIGLPSAGAIRVSLGIASNLADVERLVEFAGCYRDIEPDRAGLSPRLRC